MGTEVLELRGSWLESKHNARIQVLNGQVNLHSTPSEDVGKASAKLLVWQSWSFRTGSRIDDTPPSNNTLLEMYTLSKDVKMVTELWKEWEHGVGGGPAVKLLEERRLTTYKGWHGTVPKEYKKNGKQWTRRKYIIETAKSLAEKHNVAGTVVAERMERRRKETEGDGSFGWTISKGTDFGKSE